ncbi:MAG: Bax inhibitor-1/YccA family protein [Bdellovibrionales bacterium]|nr:Bax inhibitor-1/YccA family protein [Bdellovibrionales bacterium]
MRSGNPALRENVFRLEKQKAISTNETMTVAGTTNKTAMLLVITFLSASYTWNYIDQNTVQVLPMYLFGSAILAFIISLIIIFKKTTAPILAPVYCILEGALMGFISLFMERLYPGIVTQAILATFGVMAGLLLAYKTRLIKVTENFKLGVFAATAGIAFVYLISMIAGFFGVQVPVIHDSSPMGIAVSVIIVIVAALNLVLDFDFIENGEQIGAPKYMEWYAAFGLIVTLLWLYMEILRLLAKTRER